MGRDRGLLVLGGWGFWKGGFAFTFIGFVIYFFVSKKEFLLYF